MQAPEILQALSVVGGVATAVVGLVLARVKSQGAQALRRIDVSVEWQGQMVGRIAAVEAELQRERVRGDMLEQEGFKWQRAASELEWELKSARSERHELSKRVEDMAVENVALKKQNAALSLELRELNRQVRSGLLSPTRPPAPLVKKEK